MSVKPMPLLVLAVLVIVVGCGGPAERKEMYLLRAQEYIQQGNYPKARVALRNVLKIDPQDAEAYYLFAQVEEKEQNWRSAFANYQRVIELSPDHERALLRLGRFYLEAHALEQVEEVADRILARHPGHIPAEALKVAVQAVRGELAEAVRKAESLVARDPTEPDAALLLATLYAAQDRTAPAEPVLRRALAAHPRDLNLLSGLATILVKVGDGPKAEETLKQIIAIEPAVLDHRMRLVGFYDQQGAYDKAGVVLREAIRMDPESEQRRLALAEYLAVRRGTEHAEVALTEAQRDLPYSTKLRFALGNLYERSQRPDKARAIYEGVRDDNKNRPAGLDAMVKLAALDWAAGQEEQAERQLQQVLQENPRASEALLLHGRIALKAGNGKEAVQALRTVLKDQPEFAEAHAWLGQAHLLLGEMGLAKESFEKAVELKPPLVEVQVALAGLDASSGRLKESRQRLEEVLKRDPNDLGALGLLLNLQAVEQDWASTERTLARIRTAGAPGFSADLAAGTLAMARQQWEKAAASFERAAASKPNAPEPLAALVRLYALQGQLGKGRGRLEQAVAKNPAHPYAHGLLGEVLLLTGDVTRAEAEFETATTINPPWTTPWLRWATIHFTRRETAEATAILTRGLEQNPESEELRLLRASSLEGTGDADRAITEYDIILRKNPRALLAANNLAALLTDRRGDPQSLERALALSRQFETTAPNPYFLDTLGWVHFKLGHRDEALRVMREAVAKAPDHPILNYHLGLVYYKAGQSKEARTHLEKAVSAGKPFAGIDEARSVLSTLKG